MRLLHILPSLSQRYGGPLRVALDVPAQCLAMGMESEIAGPGPFETPDNPFPSELIHALPPAKGSSYCYSDEVRPWLRGQLGRFDVVMLHGLWTYPTWAAAEECRRRRIPYLHFTHGMLEPWSVYGQGVGKAVKKLVYWGFRERGVCTQARSLLCTTQREADLVRRMFGGVRTPITVLPPTGFDAARPAPVSPRREELRVLEGTRVALFLGRVHPKKNVEFLLRAWGRACLGKEWRLVLAGPVDSAYQAKLTQLVSELRLEDQIQFTGFVSNEDRVYLFQRADWFLLPSLQENFGIAVVEAVSQGCAVAISDRVYVAESFRKESEVLPLVESDWVEFLRERMTNLEWRETTAAADRRHLLERFEMRKVARSWVSSVERLIGAN